MKVGFKHENIENWPTKCLIHINYLALFSPSKFFVMYEHRKQKLAPMSTFYQRVFKNIMLAILILGTCLLIGVIGYHYWADAGWLDSIHNASMILSGMGPVIEIKTDAGKIFSSFYALFSGVVFITNIGIILAPALHRMYHRLHLEEE
jgi:hypothetical protein